MYKIAVAYFTYHYLPYHMQIMMETEDQGEGDCTVSAAKDVHPWESHQRKL